MTVRILIGDCRERISEIPSETVRCCVTSPPYFGLRNYGVSEQIGREASPDDYVQEMVAVFREVRRVLTDDGTLWLNMGDSYASSGRAERGIDHKLPAHSDGFRAPDPVGIKPKDLLGIPWRVAFALQADGWWLRTDIVWSKPNCMPESVSDRPTRAHEFVFLMSKSLRYHYDGAAIREPAVSTDVRKFTDGGRDKQRGYPRTHAGFNGRYAARLESEGAPTDRNARDVWTIAPAPFHDAHFATMPPELARRCVLVGSECGDTILDPFGGAGTTALVADRLERNAVMIELNPVYAEMSARRIREDAGMFADINVVSDDIDVGRPNLLQLDGDAA